MYKIVVRFGDNVPSNTNTLLVAVSWTNSRLGCTWWFKQGDPRVTKAWHPLTNGFGNAAQFQRNGGEIVMIKSQATHRRSTCYIQPSPPGTTCYVTFKGWDSVMTVTYQ